MKSKMYKFSNGGVIFYEKCKVNHATDFEFGLLQGSCVDEFSGKTHFLEHMMFKSTNNKTLEELNNDIKEKLSGINGYTSLSNIAVTIYQSNKKLEETFKIISDMMLNTKFDEDEFESEKKVILQEIARNDDNYPLLLWRNLYTSIYNYPESYSLPLGEEKEVLNLNVNELKAFAKDIIFRNNFYMSVCGSASFKRVKKLFKQNFLDKLEAKTDYKIFDTYKFDINCNSKVVVTEKDINKVYMDLAVPAFSIPSEDEFYVCEFIYQYLDEFKGVMFHELREKNSLVYQVHSICHESRKDGVMGINLETTKDKLNDCILAIGRVFDKLRKEGISQKDIDIIKNNAKINRDKSVPTPRKKTRNLLYNYLRYGHMLNKHKLNKNYFKVKKEAIDKKINVIFNPTKVWVSVLGNATKKDIFTSDKILKILNGQANLSNIKPSIIVKNKPQKMSEQIVNTKENIKTKQEIQKTKVETKNKKTKENIETKNKNVLQNAKK